MTARLPWRALLLASTATLLVAGCIDERAASPASSPGSSAPSTTTAAPVKDIDAAVARSLDAAVTTTMTAAKVPGVIVGLWGPDGQYVRAFGVADKATGAPMKTDFFHRIGSVTKTFTVTAVLQLVDQGKVALDDPIATYVDGVPNGNRITLRELARMQSGLPNYSAAPDFAAKLYSDPRHPYTPREVLDVAFAQPVEFEPGRGFQYSNTNTVLLGLVVEKVSGQSLSSYVREHVVEPLGLHHTAFPDDAAFPDPHAQGYTLGATDEEVTATDWNPSWAWAAGAMTSDLADMRTWAEALADGALLSPETQRQRMETVDGSGRPAPYGYGVGLFNLAGWVGHNGSLPGYQTVVVRLAEKRMTLVLMTTTDDPADGGEPSSALAKAITEVVTPDHVYALG